MHGESFPAGEKVAGRPERIAAGENATPGPPEANLLPPTTRPDRNELEWRHAGGRHHMMRNAETGRQLGAIAVVAVEQLQNPRRFSGCPDPVFYSVTEERVDHPDAPVDDERVRAARHEPFDEPAEAAVELVAEPDLHRCHIAAQVS
jgi:hypothetical protein